MNYDIKAESKGGTKAEDGKQNPQYPKMNLNKAATLRRQRER